MTLELISSRLVARHVGASLMVWTSVIGIILGGICLGNVLGGRLADRVEPRRAIGPLFALSSFLTLGSLWMNAVVGYLIPSPESINWELRTVLVVTLDFLIPATVLGMVGPVVAKMAVEQARKAGSAIGDVYFWGAMGSIAGTFLTGFILMYLLPSSSTALVVAAALALVAATLIEGTTGVLAGSLTALLVGLGAIVPLVSDVNLGEINLGSYKLNYIALAGNVVACFLAYVGLTRLLNAPQTEEPAAAKPARLAASGLVEDRPRTSLTDLAVLAFIASLVFMALEMVAGRLVQRHLGSSIYGWTSVIGVLLAGLSFGNYLGGKLADYIKSEKNASWLLMASSILILSVILLETQPPWLAGSLWGGEGKSFIGQAVSQSKFVMGPITISMTWPFRILFVVTVVFLLPAMTLGTVSPVVAKLAVDRLKQFHRTGTAIGQVYAWGMVGSIIGTFLTGFVLIDVFGTKGVILLLGAIMALGATMLGSVWHAIWAGVPLGLCVLAFTPPAFVDAVGQRFYPALKGASFKHIGDNWGIREEEGDPTSTSNKSEYAWIDESKYYFIKVNNERESDDIVRRTLVLDNLIHGYFVLGHPERLDYEYEHIYALVAYRAIKAGGKVKFKPATEAARHPADDGKPTGSGAGKDETTKPAGSKDEPKGDSAKPADSKSSLPAESKKSGSGLKSVQASKDEQPEGKDVPKPKGSGVPDSSDKVKEKPAFDAEEPLDQSQPSLPGVEHSDLTTLFLGGGAYCFQRHMQYAYPGTAVDVAEIDPSVTRANFIATGLPENTTIKTYWGDARQFVELHQDVKKYDLVFGDAFNDFSVPWHLTTQEFNEKIKKMLTPDGVYMINIIDAYMSDAEAEKRAVKRIEDEGVTDEAAQRRIRHQFHDEAYRFGGFVGAWARTARLTFDHVYIFGTETIPGAGDRETFVVVASNKELDLADLGRRADDPKFYRGRKRTAPKPYDPKDEQAIEDRSRHIVLTDDYAPVDNLLAPVAETRGNEDD
jgi:hypothetical protein